MAYEDPIHSASEFWELFQTKVLAKAMAKVRYDDPRLPSVRSKVLMRCFEHLSLSRTFLCRALAETTYDYMELWLVELGRRTRGRPAPMGAGPDLHSVVHNCGDGRVLAELLQTFVRLTVADCQAATPSIPQRRLHALTAQVELLAMSVVNLCRARPVLDSDFDVLNTAIVELLRAREHVAVGLLRRLLAAWPSVDSTREVRWLCLVQTILLSTPAPVVTARGTHEAVFKQIIRSLGSLHAAVARQALELCSNMYVVLHYVLPYPRLSKAVNATLVANRGHWNSVVVQMSDEQFENMLDMA